MHLLFYALALPAWSHILVAMHSAPQVIPAPVHLALALAHETADNHAGQFTLVGDLLVGGLVLIVCSAYALRHYR